MNEKELWVHLLAHHMIRLLMAQAANDAGVDPRQLKLQASLRDANANGIGAQQGLPQVIFDTHAHPVLKGKCALRVAGRAGEARY